VRGNVPQRCVAFLRALLPVDDPMRRAALMQQAFAEDWTGAAGRSSAERAEEAQQRWEAEQREKLGQGHAQGQGQGRADFVRPGRFLGTLHAMAAELERGEGGGEGGAVLLRLKAIELEALVVLDRMQRA
jgi:hypothetical protein